MRRKDKIQGRTTRNNSIRRIVDKDEREYSVAGLAAPATRRGVAQRHVTVLGRISSIWRWATCIDVKRRYGLKGRGILTIHTFFSTSLMNHGAALLIVSVAIEQ